MVGPPECLSCDRDRPGERRRGLCGSCYNRARKTGTIEEWPLRRIRNDVVIEEVVWLAEQGVPAVQWPGRIGKRISAIERALYRAGQRSLANQAGRIRRQEESLWTTQRTP